MGHNGYVDQILKFVQTFQNVPFFNFVQKFRKSLNIKSEKDELVIIPER